MLATHFRLPHADSWCRSAVLRYGAPPRGTLHSNWTRIGVVAVVVVAVAVRLTGQPASQPSVRVACNNLWQQRRRRAHTAQQAADGTQRRCWPQLQARQVACALGLALGSQSGLSFDFGG